MQRERTRNVVFRHAFTLGAIEGTMPPGTYTIETVEELIAELSFTSYRRLSTTMTVPVTVGNATARQVVEIDPQELEAALVADVRSSA